MAFLGTWETSGNENLKEFMLAAGAPPENAEKVSTVKTTVVASRDGDYYVLSATGPKGGTVEFKFIPGQEFTEAFGPLGKARQSIATVEGTTLTIRGVQPGTVVETREVNGDEMVWTLTKPGVDIVGKKFYKKIK
ncbi:fatty acid-binding protein 2-like [Glandiceps talaboti]